MLTGRLPFKGTREELRRDVLTRNPKPPRQINDTIPNELEAICLKCLAKSPEGRYSTALDFANDLREWNIRTSTVDTGRRFSSLTTMGPNSPASEGRQTTRELSSSQGQFRNRFTAIFALVFLIAVLGLAGMLTLQGPAKENKGAAQVPPDDGDHNESQLVDARAEIGAWLPLIDRTPKILVSPGTSRMAGWNFDLPKAEVSVDAIWPYLISLGETEAVEYRLQLHLVKNSYTGQAGLFYGFQESTIEDVNDERVGTKIFRCEAVVFLSDDSVKPPIFRIKRLAFEFGPIENGSHTITHVHNGSVVDIPRPPPEELELELIVSEGYLRSIRWQRQELLTLTERPGRFRLKNGRFGIINELGATRFFDARYMMTVPKSLQ
jgi:preprotein translocase subunit SecG